MTDDRNEIYIHAEAPSTDEVRVFYEIPEVVANHVKAIDPDKPFVDNLVTMFVNIDELRDHIARTGSALTEMQAAWDAMLGDIEGGSRS